MAENGNLESARPPVIELREAHKHFPIRRGALAALTGGAEKMLRAVDGISLTLHEGEALGLAGESGCGKTTTGRLLLRLHKPTSGQILFRGQDISNFQGAELKAFRRHAQFIFQNPYEALNPRFTIERALQEPLIIHKAGNTQEMRARIIAALDEVNLSPPGSFLAKYPHQMSGGQLQRVVLARSLIMRPSFVVADEPVSMLDVSIRASVLNLMKGLAESLNLGVVYISHDLSLIQYMCKHTAIMYLGRIVEMGPTQAVIQQTLHPYTRALVSAVPVPDPDISRRALRIKDMIPSPTNLPAGCRFHPRCPDAMPHCAHEAPPQVEVSPGHWTECWLYA